MTNQQDLKEAVLQQRHSFSDLAKEHGATAAVLLKYLAYKVSKSHKEHQGRKWHYETTKALAARFPYFTPSTINATLNKLTGSILHRGNFNRKGFDRTSWYAFRDDNTRKRALNKAAYFRVADAVKYQLPAAVLIWNLKHWKIGRAHV